MDHACQELEGKIRKLLPEGGPISQSQLSAATLALNSKLHRRGTLSAYEIHSAHNFRTGNLKFSNARLRRDQIKSREPSQPAVTTPVTQPLPGDTMTPLSEQPKHTARSMYLVTSSSPEVITAQKILHPLSSSQTKFMSKQYSSNPKYLRIIHRPNYPVLSPSRGSCMDPPDQTSQSSPSPTISA